MPQKTEDAPHHHAQTSRGEDLPAFTRRVLVASTIVSLFLLAWHVRQTVILAFAAVVVAAILLAANGLTRRFIPLGHRTSLALTGLVLAALIGLMFWFAWPNLQTQISNLFQQLSDAVSSIEERTGINMQGSLEQFGGMFERIWSDLARLLQTAVTAITGLILVVIAGAFLAVNPRIYRRGLILMFPPTQHRRVGRALTKTGTALKLWLVGQLVSMTIIGLLVGLGTWWVGLPSPFALATLAFLTEFIPLVGPFLGAVPGLLLALGESWQTFLWTALLYVAIQQVESNLITPLVQREMVRVPPALFMLSVIAMGALFGVLGVLLAGPLTVTAFVLVRTLYIKDTLGESIGQEEKGAKSF